jgi:cell pole-organizing protein PopZ
VKTQSDEQQEPSMEEILSSIRRIIADEATEGDEDDQLVTDGRNEGSDRESEADALVRAMTGADGDDEDVLELTEMVREGGEVVELDVAAAQLQPSEQQPDEPGAGEQEEAAQGDLEAEPGEEPLGLSQVSPPVDGFAAEQPADDDAAPSPIVDIQDEGMENDVMAMQTNQNGLDSLVSDQAAGAATGAFAKLAQAVQRTPPELAIADDSGRTTEQFVEDMMRPMLRDWLEQNLPVMVERIVQREVQKIVRRAEAE